MHVYGLIYGDNHSRNQATREIAKSSSQEWKKAIGYHIRSLVETTMYRLKTTFTGKFKSREIEHQELEARLMCNVLNKYIVLAKPRYV